jgi:molybdopterin synthase catalytic subunit
MTVPSVASVTIRSAPVTGRAGAAGTPYTEIVPAPLLWIGPEPLELGGIVAALELSPGGNPGADGALVTFLGLVRNHNTGRAVRYLEYEAYEPLALKAFERIAAETAARWPDARLALHHRTGRLEIGDASIAIAARAPHRANAYAACRYAIERVKQIAPIWKREFFEGGDVWIEGATADPDARDAQAEAERIACA